MDEKNCVGAIVCKLDLHKKMVRRGYIAMLAVDQSARRRGIGRLTLHAHEMLKHAISNCSSFRLKIKFILCLITFYKIEISHV